MTTKKLWLIWGIYYIVCAAFGFIPGPSGAWYGLLFCIGLGFFIPGGMLLYRAVKQSDQKALRWLRGISLFSLIATVTLFILTVLAAAAPAILGDFLHFLMVICCAPMVCAQVWLPVLFGWACMLMICLQHRKKTGKK